MGQDTKIVNKTMFWIGIAMIIIVATLLLTVKSDLGVWPMFIGLMGNSINWGFKIQIIKVKNLYILQNCIIK